MCKTFLAVSEGPLPFYTFKCFYADREITPTALHRPRG